MEVKEDTMLVQKFVDNVADEYQYLSTATEYRKRTAKLALHIALKTDNVEPFLDKRTSLSIVAEMLPKTRHDNDRVQDVAKMLRMCAVRLKRTVTDTKEMQEYVREMMKKTPLTY